MQLLETSYPFLSSPPAYVSRKDNGDKVLVYERGLPGIVFIFNFNPVQSFVDYRVGVAFPGKYKVALNTDREMYDGHDRIDESVDYISEEGNFDGRHHSVYMYIPSRTAIVLRKVD